MSPKNVLLTVLGLILTVFLVVVVERAVALHKSECKAEQILRGTGYGEPSPTPTSC